MRTRILEEHLAVKHIMFQKGIAVSTLNENTMTSAVVHVLKTHPAAFYGVHGMLALSAAELDAHLQWELSLVQRQTRCVRQLILLALRSSFFCNNMQCFDLKRWEMISSNETMPRVWDEACPEVSPDAHRDILLRDYNRVARAVGVDRTGGLFETLKSIALGIWKAKKEKLPADKKEKADYNGPLMLDSWLEAFDAFQLKYKSSGLQPLVPALALLRRNTVRSERSLKAVKHSA